MALSSKSVVFGEVRFAPVFSNISYDICQSGDPHGQRNFTCPVCSFNMIQESARKEGQWAYFSLKGGKVERIHISHV